MLCYEEEFLVELFLSFKAKVIQKYAFFILYVTKAARTN